MNAARTVVTITTVGRASIVTATDLDTGISTTCSAFEGRFRNQQEALRRLEELRLESAR